MGDMQTSKEYLDKAYLKIVGLHKNDSYFKVKRQIAVVVSDQASLAVASISLFYKMKIALQFNFSSVKRLISDHGQQRLSIQINISLIVFTAVKYMSLITKFQLHWDRPEVLGYSQRMHMD